jgi:hypothetical protein
MVNEWLNGGFDELLKHAYATRWTNQFIGSPYGENKKRPMTRQMSGVF